MSDKDIFANLVPLKSRLKDASVKANAVLKGAKERLQEVGLGVEAWVTIEAEYDEASRRSTETEFGYAHRHLGDDPDFPETQSEKGSRWDLWVRSSEEDGYHGYHHAENPAPVLSCRRDVRIAAARALPKLVEKLKENAEKAISEIDEAGERFS